MESRGGQAGGRAGARMHGLLARRSRKRRHPGPGRVRRASAHASAAMMSASRTTMYCLSSAPSNSVPAYFW